MTWASSGDKLAERIRREVEALEVYDQGGLGELDAIVIRLEEALQEYQDERATDLSAAAEAGVTESESVPSEEILEAWEQERGD